MSRTSVEAVRYLQDKAVELSVFKVCYPVISDSRFAIWTASSNPQTHHYGFGQLAIHTAEVVELCLKSNENLSAGINLQELFLAAFFHDVGKMEDYETVGHEEPNPSCSWTVTEHKVLIHHITRSALIWDRCSDSVPHLKDPVLHAILSHHGRPEWGSPVLPRTKTAFMLHLCDSISARMNDADKKPILLKKDIHAN